MLYVHPSPSPQKNDVTDCDPSIFVKRPTVGGLPQARRQDLRAFSHQGSTGIPAIWFKILAMWNWLVVSTPLKNISQLGWLFPIIIWKKKCSKPPTSEFCENMRNRFWGRTSSICMRVSRPLNPAKFSLATIMTKNTEHILENLKSALEQTPWNLWFSIGRNCQFSTKHENLLSTPAKTMHAIWGHNPK